MVSGGFVHVGCLKSSADCGAFYIGNERADNQGSSLAGSSVHVQGSV